MESNLIKSKWSNKIYPCSEGCGFIGKLDAFAAGECYDPCPNCGAARAGLGKTGRFVYQLEPIPWFPFINRKKFVRVEWY